MGKNIKKIASFIWKGATNLFKKFISLFKNAKTKGFLGKWAIRIVALLLVFFAVAFLWISRSLPSADQFSNRDVLQSTKIFARDGTLLYQSGGNIRRTVIDFSQMNSNVKQSTISVEDKSFYNEGGISIRGILRSAVVDIFHLGASQGGSTITQQYVRNAVLTQKKTFTRKIEEAILSIEVDEKYSKDQVLQFYLNEIPYGRNVYGIQAAAQSYFNIDAQNLDLAESAYLAAMIQAPNHYDPFGPYRQQLDDRKNTVLDLMLQQGYINQQQHDQAKIEQAKFVRSQNSIIAPHFVFYIQNYLEQKYGADTVENGGLQVYTTLDPKLQTDAEQAIDDYSAINTKKYNGNNEALTAIDPKTGQILAMVGSKDYFGTSEPAGCTPGLNCTFEPNVNVATSLRQPGSSVKPYVYGTAFEQPYNMNPASLLYDVVTDFGNYGGKDYIPRDYDLKERGPVSVRSALDGSLNIPAVKTLDIIGVSAATTTMKNFGITTPLSSCSLSLVLGGCEVTLLDHVSGYATFATEGVHHQATGILKITDSSGSTLEEYKDKSSTVMDPQAAYEIDNILTDNSARAYVFGANSPLQIPGRTVAAKTGTTQNYRDGWTLGFTPSLAAGVWVGNNDGTNLKGGSDGVVVAAPIWNDFMKKALANTPNEDFPVPQGIQTVTIDSLSGLLPTQYSPSTKTDVFASYSVPTTSDNIHIPSSETLCSQYNNCPASGVYTILKSEKPNDPAWEQPVESWATAHGYIYPIGNIVNTPTNDNNNTGNTQNNNTNNDQPQAPENPGNPPEAKILSPGDGAETGSLVTITVEGIPDNSNGNNITRMDLLLDGSILQSVNNTSTTSFNLNGLSDGQHTIALHVVDDQGNTGDTSITINTK